MKIGQGKKGPGRRNDECEDPRAGRSYGQGVRSPLTEGRAGAGGVARG